MDIETDNLCATLGMILCVYAALKITKIRRRRRFKTRPINRKRRLSGNFQYYINMKVWDLDQFFKYTRMTPPVFEKLLTWVKPHIQKEHRSDDITAEERLVITLQ